MMHAHKKLFWKKIPSKIKKKTIKTDKHTDTDKLTHTEPLTDTHADTHVHMYISHIYTRTERHTNILKYRHAHPRQ